MREILVKLGVPALNGSFDVFVPTELEIGELVEILVSGVRDLSNGKYYQSGHEQLAMKSPEMLLDPTRTLGEYSVPECAELMLL